MTASSMLHGMVFKKEAEGDISSVKDAKIAVFSCPFDCMVTETKVSGDDRYIKFNEDDADIALGADNSPVCSTGHSVDK